MKKFDKKGFTIVELVIVIAVIAILAGIMIPTFSSVTKSAEEAAVAANAAEAYKKAMAADMADGYQDKKIGDADIDFDDYIDVTDATITYDVAADGSVTATYTEGAYKAELANGKWTVGPKS